MYQGGIPRFQGVISPKEAIPLNFLPNGDQQIMAGTFVAGGHLSAPRSEFL